MARDLDAHVPGVTFVVWPSHKQPDHYPPHWQTKMPVPPGTIHLPTDTNCYSETIVEVATGPHPVWGGRV